MSDQRDPVTVQFDDPPHVVVLVHEAPTFGVIFDIVLKAVVALFLISLVLGLIASLAFTILFGLALHSL